VAASQTEESCCKVTLKELIHFTVNK